MPKTFYQITKNEKYTIKNKKNKKTRKTINKRKRNERENRKKK